MRGDVAVVNLSDGNYSRDLIIAVGIDCGVQGSETAPDFSCEWSHLPYSKPSAPTEPPEIKLCPSLLKIGLTGIPPVVLSSRLIKDLTLALSSQISDPSPSYSLI
jgi:hypothetical protein